MEEDKKKNKQIILALFLALGVIGLVGVTYSFFNYTRTGAINNLGTGRIYFNSTQNGTLNMTNVFPMTSSEAEEANLDAITVGIVGDTTYANGEEFEITLVDVTNTINGKQIPISYIATYAATTGNSIGEESDTYWESRESKNADIYLLNATGEVEEGKQVLVGYIKNSDTGINGTLTIKAYIDADRIAISDTYPEGTIRNVITTGYSSSNCETALTGVQNASTYCASIEALQDAIDNEELTSAQITLLVNAGLVEEYTNGTTSEWVRGRTVLTTSEWNSLQGANSVSFKIRAESNEGIWAEEPIPRIESCPDCKFMYYVVDPNDIATEKWTTWNSLNQTQTQITSGLYDNYEELIEATGKNYFLGVKLNSNNEVTNAYACGVKDNVPFCLEGTSDGSKYTANQTLLQGANLYNNSCTVGSNYTDCGPWDNSGSLSAGAMSLGAVDAGVSGGDRCGVSQSGFFECFESVAVGPDPGGGGE